MALTAKEAIQLLIDYPDRYPTPDTLKHLVSQLDITATGQYTLLYSGNMGDVRTSRYITDMVESGANVRVIDNTEAFEFLDSDDFKEAVARAHGVAVDKLDDRTSVANAFINDGKTGAWADVSERFVRATEGEVRTLTPEADFGRVFGQREFPAALETEKITTINGESRENLQRLYQDHLPTGAAITEADQTTAHKIAFDTVNSSSRDYVSKIEPDLALKPPTLESLQNAALANEHLQTYTRESLTLAESAGDTARTADLLRHMDKLGAVGTAIEVAVIAHDANAAMDNGDTAAAEVIVAEGIAKLAGSTAGGMIAAEIIGAGLMLAGVSLTAPVAIALMVGAGIVGGIAGDEIVDAAIDTLRDATGQNSTEPPVTPLTIEITGGQKLPGTQNAGGSNTNATAPQNQTPPPETPPRDIDTPEIIVTTPDRLILSRSAGAITTMTTEEATALTISRIDQLAADHDKTTGSDHQLSVWRDNDGNITGYQIDSTATSNGQTRNETLVFDARGKLISGGTTVHDDQGILADVTMTEAQKTVVQDYYETAFEDIPVAATQTDNLTPEQAQAINEQHPQPVQTAQNPIPLITDLNPDAPWEPGQSSGSDQTETLLPNPTPQTLAGATGAQNVLNLIQSIQNGNGLGILTNGVSAINNFSAAAGIQTPIPGEISTGLGMLGTGFNLIGALDNGNTLGAIQAGLSLGSQVTNVLTTQGMQTASSLLAESTLHLGSGMIETGLELSLSAGQALESASQLGSISSGLGAAAGAIGLVIAIQNGDPFGIASSTLSLLAALQIIPVWGQIAAVVITILGALFGKDDPPEITGSAIAAYDEHGRLTAQTDPGKPDQNGGAEHAVQTLQTLLDGFQSALPAGLVIVPQRLPTLGYHSQEDTHLLLGLPDGSDSWYHGDNQNRIGQDFIQRSLDNQAIVTQAEADTIQVRLERDPNAWFESANSEWKNFEAAA